MRVVGVPRSEEFDIFLLEAVGDGDREAFDELYRRHVKAVYRYAWALADNADLPEELVQETFVTLWRKRGKVTVVDESALAWLLSVCKNHFCNLRRRDARHNTIPLDSVREPAGQASDDFEWIRDELNALSSTDREVCDLCLIQGYSYKDAGELLDLTTPAVGKRLERARARLRNAVNHHGN